MLNLDNAEVGELLKGDLCSVEAEMINLITETQEKNKTKDAPRHSSFVPTQESPVFKHTNSVSSNYRAFDLNEQPLEFHHYYKRFVLELFHPYLTEIVDVMGDGNCGFRSIATALGEDEDNWVYVRRELLDELISNKDYYEERLLGMYNEVHKSLNWFYVGIPESKHWLNMSITGLLISNRFKVICLCLIFTEAAANTTTFPSRFPLESYEPHRIITIVHVP